MATREKLTLVLGGNGKTGRRVAQRLAEKGVPVRVSSRSTAPAFDWNDRSTWVPILKDVQSAYVTYSPDLAVPGAAAAVGELAGLAIKSGVRRLVLLSGRGEEGALLGEKAVRDSGAEWTIVRCAWFNQNFSEGFFREQVASGEVALPARGAIEPFVDAEDIADVAVAALTEDGHAGEVYELTGPRLMTFPEAVAQIAEATGRAIRYVPISIDEYRSLLEQSQVPAEIVSLVVYVFAEVLDGRNARLADGVQRALRRQPRDFSDYARSAAAAGAWTS